MSTPPPNCRNCGGTERYAREVNGAGGYGPDLLPIGFFTKRTFRIEICGTCGHVEWFVPVRFLPKVRSKFERLS